MTTCDETLREASRRGGRRAAGLSLIGVGLLLFAQQAGYLGGRRGGLWTLIPAVVGLVHLFEPGRRSLGLVLLAWGLLLTAHQLELLSLERSWPLMVVAAGAGIVVQGFDHGRPRWHHRGRE